MHKSDIQAKFLNMREQQASASRGTELLPWPPMQVLLGEEGLGQWKPMKWAAQGHMAMTLGTLGHCPQHRAWV